MQGISLQEMTVCVHIQPVHVCVESHVWITCAHPWLSCVHVCTSLHRWACIFVWFLLILKDSPPQDLGKTSADEREETLKTANGVWNVPQSEAKGRKKTAILAACESHPTELIWCISIVVAVLEIRILVCKKGSVDSSVLLQCAWETQKGSPKCIRLLLFTEQSPGWHRGGILLTSSGFVYILLKNNLHSAMGAVLKTYCFPLFPAASMAHSCSYWT